jgi:hypothetical protein
VFLYTLLNRHVDGRFHILDRVKWVTSNHDKEKRIIKAALRLMLERRGLQF